MFGTVSYYVQKLLSTYQGVWYLDTDVSSSDGDSHNHGIAASASCQNTACTKLAFKVSQSDLERESEREREREREFYIFSQPTRLYRCAWSKPSAYSMLCSAACCGFKQVSV